MARFWWLFLLLAISVPVLHAQSNIVELCSSSGIAVREGEYKPGGIILTAFDGAALWVYDIDRVTRYPLPDTRPCLSNCRLSPDAHWLTYLDPNTLSMSKMRVDGTQRTPLFLGANDLQWWSNERFLVWTVDHRIYVQTVGSGEETREYLSSQSVISVQPNGQWGIFLELQPDGSFMRILTNLLTRGTADERRLPLAAELPYFNAQAWSSDGKYLVYVAQGDYNATAQTRGAELYLLPFGEVTPRPLTSFAASYGAVRIGGYDSSRLAWSPQNDQVAFWVTSLLGPNPEANTGKAQIHVVNIATGAITRYCGYATDEHTPNPPRLAWSPDGSQLAFASDIDGDGKGALLLALNVATGGLTELSNGIFPALGRADVVAWGQP